MPGKPWRDACLLAIALGIIAVVLLITLLFPARLRGAVSAPIGVVPSSAFSPIILPVNADDASVPHYPVGSPSSMPLTADDAQDRHYPVGSPDSMPVNAEPTSVPHSPVGSPSSMPVKPEPTSVRHSAVGSLLVRGSATWYRWRLGQAAAGPALRSALGARWRGTVVAVCASGRCVTVRLTDWCACGHGRVIDLDRRAFAALAAPSRGVIRVEVSRSN